MANSVDQDQTPQNPNLIRVYTVCLIMKHYNDKNQPDTPYIGNERAQRVKVEECTRHKWVKVCLTLEFEQSEGGTRATSTNMRATLL